MNTKILWVDDEIDLLKPHILFLQAKGYDVVPAMSGIEALDILEKEFVNIIFLDENMPGLSGLETLQRIKKLYPHIPVVMITKSEEEHIMEDAIGSNISDYLIKPVNPNQILLCLKKNIDKKELVSNKVTINYQQSFRELSMRISDRLHFQGMGQKVQILGGGVHQFSTSEEQTFTHSTPVGHRKSPQLPGVGNGGERQRLPGVDLFHSHVHRMVMMLEKPVISNTSRTWGRMLQSTRFPLRAMTLFCNIRKRRSP